MIANERFGFQVSESGSGYTWSGESRQNQLDDYLMRRADGLVVLFAPPFDDTLLAPGYIKGYPPGVRENGGQYRHAASPMTGPHIASESSSAQGVSIRD